MSWMRSGTSGSTSLLGDALGDFWLICGILSSLLYACMDVIAGTRWQSYSWVSEEFSRLSAIGAPSRPLILLLSPVYTVLVVAFGLQVWQMADQKRVLRVV